jgi:hypothetical protein
MKYGDFGYENGRFWFGMKNFDGGKENVSGGGCWAQFLRAD